MKLRDYQQEIVDAVFKEWEEAHSTVVVAPVGCGKTVVFAAIIQRMHPKRALVIAERRELIHQACDKIHRVTGLECGIEMADSFVNKSLFGELPVVVSTIQTQISSFGDRRRMSRFHPKDFGVLVVDECFPAGTPVDGRPIESLRIGDPIHTHNGLGRVVRVFKKKTDCLCRIRLQSGRLLTCTPNHPIWTTKGFTPAIMLTQDSMVATITQYEAMWNMRRTNTGHPNLVRQEGMQVAAFQKHDNRIIQEARRGNNTVPSNQRDVTPGSASEGINQTKSDGLDADEAQRQRSWPNSPRAGAGCGPWLGHQCGGSDQSAPSWFSQLLQAGRWEYRFEDWGGGGWLFSLRDESQIPRPEEGGVFEFDRVESVTFLEQGSCGEFERLCPEGIVYNLEVSNGATYFANGVLVHNCHHSTAKSYRDLINYYRKWNPEIKIVGTTATPDRADEEALGQVFDTVAYDMEILDAIHRGWLVPIHQQFVQTKADFSHIRTTAGDLNGADLAAVMEAEENMQAVTGASIEIIGQRRALVFTASVKQAEMVANIFNRHRAGTADWVCGKTNEEKRAELLRRFQNGDIQVMANCNCLSEGYDDPGVDVVIQARPTKSRSLYAQQIGRCARPLPGVVDGPETAELRKAAIAASAKPNCEVVDFVGNSGKHKLMTTADILGGKVSEEVVRIAIAKSKNTGGDMVKAIDETLEEMEKARLAEEARKARLVARVQYSSKHISPFDALDIEPVKERGWDNNKRLTDKQLAMLRRNGVNADKMPYGQAKQLLIAMFARMDNKMATLKQCSLLKKFGYETKYLKMSDATKLIDALKANNWNKPAERTHETTVQNA